MKRHHDRSSKADTPVASMPAVSPQPRAARNARLAARLTEQQKQELEAAAQAADMSLSAFVLKAARFYHRILLRRRQLVRLGERDQHALVEALLRPVAPGKRLVAAMQRYQDTYSQEGRGL